MPIHRSGFVHLLDLAGDSVMAIHAVSQTRVTVTADVARLIAWFDQPRNLNDALPALSARLGAEPAVIDACIRMLLDRGVLTELDPHDEHTAILQDLQGRDPVAQLDKFRRTRMEGAHPYWAVQAPQTLAGPASLDRRLDVLLLGDCDVQMEAEFLRTEAAARGVDLRAAASFAADTGLAAERHHDAIIIGALQERHAIVLGDAEHHNGEPARVYVQAVEAMLLKLRALTAAPILIDSLPEPTVQPLGFADRGPFSHRNRFRRTNLALSELAEAHPDVHLVDVAAAFAQAGSAALLDDGLVSFTHFGSAGWMLQRPPSELAAVHNLFPDPAPLASYVDGNPFGRETIMARTHMDTLTVVLGIDRKKCIIVDLDGVLWPGVLAETGMPFNWEPDIGGPHSYIGLYFGIQEALRTLRRRGILLACVSKNDEPTVRGLWRYPQPYPRHRLLSPNHFVTTRINWRDKADNIASIAEELGFPLDAFLFIDDSARERARIRENLPEVAVLGDNLFALRRILLTDPRLQSPRVTDEAAARGDLMKAKLDRTRLRRDMPDEATFLASLEIAATVECLTQDSATSAILERITELFARTTQFNATARRFAPADLQRLVGQDDAHIFILRMQDRLADHGLVGAAVVERGAILNLVISCRVIGLGGEKSLLDHILRAEPAAVGRIVRTDRNVPVRHLYRDNGFTDRGQGHWVRSAADAATTTRTPEPAAA